LLPSSLFARPGLGRPGSATSAPARSLLAIVAGIRAVGGTCAWAEPETERAEPGRQAIAGAVRALEVACRVVAEVLVDADLAADPAELEAEIKIARASSRGASRISSRVAPGRASRAVSGAEPQERPEPAELGRRDAIPDARRRPVLDDLLRLESGDARVDARSDAVCAADEPSLASTGDVAGL
jgi:hypothetical protein